jgi:hypothetical protein
MKKILTLVCCTILLAATSCTKKYITPANRTVFFDVKGGAAPAGGWIPTTNGGSPAYQVTLGGDTNELPELDNFTQQNGAVLVYISFDNGDTYEAVPENFGGVSYSFIHTTNTIIITSQASSGSTAVLPTSNMHVKVVLVDSEPQN